MAKVDKLIESSKEHLNQGEQIIAVAFGVYETKIMGEDTVRNGILLATDNRIVFYAKKMFGFDLESFPYSNISSLEMSKGFMGYKISFFSSGNKVSVKWINEQHCQGKDMNGFVEFVRSNIGKKENSTNSRGSSLDIPEQIKKLAELNSQGILTDDEFSKKKAILLEKM